MLHHTRRWNRDHSDELRSAWLNGVGMLVWENVFGAWVGWNERDRGMLRRMTAIQRRHAAAADDGRVDAARGAQRRRLGRRLPLAPRRRRALGAREHRLDARSQGRSISPDARSSSRSRCPASRRSPRTGVEVIGGGSSAYPARPTVRREPPRVSVAGGARRIRRGRPTRGRSSPGSGVREPGIYGEVPYVEEWKPLPPRLHVERRGRAAGASRAVRDRRARGDRCLRRAAHRPDARRGARACRGRRRPPSHRGRVAAGRGGRAARARGAARLELDGERAQRRADALRDPQGRRRLEGRGLRLVRRRRAAGSRLLVRAAPDAARSSARRRSASGSRSTYERARSGSGCWRPRRSLRRRSPGCSSATSAPTWSRSSTRSGPTRRAATGPAKDGEGLWFKALARNKRLVTLDLSNPEGRDVFLDLAAGADVVLENFRPGTLERWGAGPGRALGAESAARDRAGHRLRPDGPVRVPARDSGRSPRR